MKKAVKKAATVVATPTVNWPVNAIVGSPPVAAVPLQAVVARLRQLALAGEIRPLHAHLSRRTLQAVRAAGGDPRLAPVAPRTLGARLRGEVVGVRYEGYRATVLLRQGDRQRAAFFFLEEGGWRLDLSGLRDWRRADSGEAVPSNRAVSLAEATAGVAGEGLLMAHFDTSAGAFSCQLHETRAPRTVAHFVGLARGLRAHMANLTDADQPDWVHRPFYDGLRFHRVRADHFIQTGDPSGSGRGGAGFTIADEFDPALRHNQPGVLSLASAGPNTGSSQVLISLRAAPQYDDVHTVFGHCKPLPVLERIASAPASSHFLRTVRFSRQN